MNEVYEFLKKCGVYYLATVEGDRPRVRPFGTVDLYEGKLYFQTGKAKEVSRQMHVNPRVELCGFAGGQWLRVEATAVEDSRTEAQAHMLETYPNLRDRYAPGDGNMEVFYLKDATATFSSFTSEPRVVRF